MNTRSYNDRLSVEPLERRNLMSTMAYGDFNHDGREDKVEVTDATTITVSLKKLDGTYAVSAVLTAPKNLPVVGINVDDYNHDGKLDISAGGLANNRFYSHTWLGNGNGTFGNRITEKGSPIPKWWV